MSRFPIRVEGTESWLSPRPGVRVQVVEEDGARLRLVEMLDSAEHPEWCEVGHAGAVIEGALEVEFEDGTVRFEAGDGIVIPPGPAHKHRPRAVSSRVRLALTDLAS